MEDRIFKGFLWSCGALGAALVFLMLISLVKGSLVSIRALGLGFLTGTRWDPVTDTFGVAPFVVGTFITSVLALIVAFPFALSVALFVGFYVRSEWLKELLGYASDLLAGIPSVIYGFWGLFFLVPLVRDLEMKLSVTPYGVGILTVSLVLAVMIIPYMSSMIAEAVRMVPVNIIEAGYSLGATDFDVVFKVIFPYIKSSIFASVLLAFGRAVGETMAVTMVIGNSNELPRSIFSPANTLASLIANEFTEAVGDVHLSALVEAGLLLFVISFAINWLGQKVVERAKVP